MKFDGRSGNTRTQAQCVDMLKTGGTVVYVGMAPGRRTPLNINGLMSKEATVKTIFHYRSLYPTAIAEVGAGCH